MAGHDNTPSILEAEACMSMSLRLVCFYGEFQDSQGYTVRPCLKIKLFWVNNFFLEMTAKADL